MNSYQKEQLDALQMVFAHLQSLNEAAQRALLDLTAEYRAYRKDVNAFLTAHLADVCTQKCYQSRLSACCSKEGIITFFADVVINALVSSEEEFRGLVRVLEETHEGFKCIYLGPDGCRWQLKPIVCEMFICDAALEQVFSASLEARLKWEELKHLKKQFTWPDRPVLFDTIEALFIKAGCSSPLMYLHNSPGLLRVKQRAKLKPTGKGAEIR